MGFKEILKTTYKKLLTSSDERNQNIKKNVVGSLAIKGCSILIQLLLVPLTLHYLNADVYGIWLTLSSIVLWLGFFDIGFTQGLKNKLAETVAVGNLARGKKLVSTTYVCLICIFVPLCIILEFLVPVVHWSKFLNVPEIYNPQITQVMHVLIVCVCIQMVANTISAVVSAFQKVAIANSFPVIGNFFSIIIVYVLTKTTEPSMLYLALTVSFAPVIVMIVASLYLYNTKLKSIRPSVKYFDKSLIKDIFNLGVKFFIINIQVIVMYQSTNILISNISSPTDVTAYNIAYKYVGTAMMILAVIMGPFWPAFTEAYTTNNFQWMRTTYKKIKILYCYVLAAIIIMVLISSIVYKLWVGSTSLVPWAMTISIGIYMIVDSWFSIIINLINGIGTIKLQSIVTLIGVFIHIPLSLFLGKYVGAIGVVISMTILTTIYSILFTIQLDKILNKTAKGIWLE